MNELDHLADTIGRAQHGPAWYGPSLSELLKDVTAESASSRVADLHTIWELTEHIIAWLDIVRRRIEGERLDDDNLTWEDNWPPVRGNSENDWQKTVARAAHASQELARSVRGIGGTALDRLVHGESFSDSKLDCNIPGKDYTFSVMLHGAAQHVTYHAGQIAVLKKLLQTK